MNTRWDLSKIYDSFESKLLKDDLNRIKELMCDGPGHYTSYFSKADPDRDKLVFYINTANELNSTLLKLTAFARLHLAAHAGSHKALKLESELKELLPGLNNLNLPFLRFLNTLDNLDELIDSDPLLTEHRFILKDLKEQSEYILSEEMEELLRSLQETGSIAYERLIQDLNRELNVEVRMGDDPRRIPLSVARNLAYAQSQELRKAAYQGELRAYRKIQTPAAACLNGIKGEALILCRARGFESPLHMSLFDARMDKQTLDAMFDVIRENREYFRKYLRKKAELLGHNGPLPFYDLYAPMGHFDIHYSPEEAREHIERDFSAFSEDMGNFAARAFEEGWVDMDPGEGRESGMFCCNIHAMKESRIFTNYSGSYYDYVNIAHELGHAYHNDKLNSKTMLNTDYTMPMAETASIFCQTLVTMPLLEHGSDATRFAILEDNLLNYTQILIEILARYTFETNLFEKRKNGPLSVEELNELMLDAQEYAYGDGLTPEKHPYMWICKPHYYFPDFHFYNYSYPFGLLFSKGLYAMYLKEGSSFAPKFEEVLRATGSASMSGLLRLLGVKPDDRQFFRDAMKLLTDQIDLFLKLDPSKI